MYVIHSEEVLSPDEWLRFLDDSTSMKTKKKQHLVFKSMTFSVIHSSESSLSSWSVELWFSVFDFLNVIRELLYANELYQVLVLVVHVEVMLYHHQQVRMTRRKKK